MREGKPENAIVASDGRGSHDTSTCKQPPKRRPCLPSFRPSCELSRQLSDATRFLPSDLAL